MSPEGPTGFYVQVSPGGSLLLRGELDMTTVQDLQDKIDEILVRGTPIVVDLAQLRFLDSSAIHSFVRACEQSGHPVVLDNASSTVRRILDVVGPEPEAWVYDGQGPPPVTG
jgi:anti-anti-sigma factor